jgi:hypothetical protein
MCCPVSDGPIIFALVFFYPFPSAKVAPMAIFLGMTRDTPVNDDCPWSE